MVDILLKEGAVRLEAGYPRAPVQTTILRVTGNVPGGHPNDAMLFGLWLSVVLRSHEQRLYSMTPQILTKCSDGSGNAIDPWEIDVGDEKDAHELAVSTQRQPQRPERCSEGGARQHISRVMQAEDHARAGNRQGKRDEHPTELRKVHRGLQREAHRV